MLDHYIQKKIIASLVESDGARFAELRPDNVEANTFTYHLQQLVKSGLVEKSDDGLYRLTARGKLAGINISLSARDLLLQAHSIILIVASETGNSGTREGGGEAREGSTGAHGGGRWLLRRRLVQPQYGRVGFIHGEPTAGRTVVESAAHTLERRTGLAADFTVRGSGFVTIRHDDEVESYTHFVLVEATNLRGELIARDSHGENIWLDSPDFSAPDMIGSMKELTTRFEKSAENSDQFFADITIDAE